MEELRKKVLSSHLSLDKFLVQFHVRVQDSFSSRIPSSLLDILRTHYLTATSPKSEEQKRLAVSAFTRSLIWSCADSTDKLVCPTNALVQIVELTVLFVYRHLKRKEMTDGDGTRDSLTKPQAYALLHEADAYFKWAQGAQMLLFEFYQSFGRMEPINPGYHSYELRRNAVAAWVDNLDERAERLTTAFLSSQFMPTKRRGRSSTIKYPELLLPISTPESGQRRNHQVQNMLQSIGTLPRRADADTTVSDWILAAISHCYLSLGPTRIGDGDGEHRFSDAR